MVEGKQVKVDNWGIFFLQRLQQFYNKTIFCDLTLQFEDNVQVKVHRLVMNACTEYFQMLENTCVMQKDCLLMPSNLPSDVVIPIINFMYSGILEFQESLFDRLYSTAKLMNMSVLTKLLDAQKTPIKPVTPVPKRVQSVTPITWNLQGKKIMTKNFMEPDLPETLPGRKLPIWKRKSAPNSVTFVSANSSSNYDTYSPKVKSEEAPKPTRFEWPDEDDSNFENSFDEISYASKPLILPSVQTVKEKSPKPSTSSTFEEIKKTALPVKRSASPIGNQCKKVNIQDVKEYLKEHKIRSDYIDYDDSEMADNDLQTYDNDDSNEERSQDAADIFTQNTEESPSKSILKSESSTPTTNKHVRFSLEGKENSNTKVQSVAGKSVTPKPSSIKPAEQTTVDMSKHTKIITEVLKKYPHLVKNNKNIRLKILAKGNSPSNQKTAKALAVAKPTSKVSYMVMKPDVNQKTNTPSSSDKDNANSSESNSWECTRCEEPRQFQSYHTYRQHLTEAHNEKTDSQMCILCGHISRKQNMLVYHKYVKHNIPPPAMYNFPKCKDCNYVALSQTLLLRHQLSHNVLQMSCAECGVSCANKAALLAHLQQTGHSQDRVTPHFSCNYCDKRFFSENILNTHIKRNHSEIEEKTQMVEMKNDLSNQTKSEIENTTTKPKEKVKILSDIKVNTTPTGTLVPVRTLGDLRTMKQDHSNERVPEPLEPSSEAEALSNVASGIAASLGLVDTIVVLDDNQFILQSSQHPNMQENILNSSGQEYILPEMQISDLSTIASTSMDQVSQHPTVTLSSDTNTVLTQSLNKSGMTSTDELVMVLTDHDYSDAANNAVITDNNIVVLYSHPVQTQATMMINSETGMIEVGKNYAVASEMPVSVPDQVVNCEESIEMIQQEINNQLETENQEQQVEMQQYVHQNAMQNVEEKMEVESCVEPYQVCSGNVTMILENNQVNDLQKDVHIEEIPTHHQEIEESIEMIQDEINRIPQQITEELVEKVCEEQVQQSTISTSDIPETIHINEEGYETVKDNNFENERHMEYNQEIIQNQETITAVQESINDEQVIMEEHADNTINMQNQNTIHTENVSENMQMEISDCMQIENKGFKSQTEVVCESEDSQSFNTNTVAQLELIEHQTEYTEPVEKQEAEVVSNEILENQVISVQENVQSNNENMQIIEQISAESVQTEEIEVQEILLPVESSMEDVPMEQSVQESIENMDIMQQQNIDTNEQNILIMEQHVQDNVEVTEQNVQIVEGNQESILVETSIQISEEIKEEQEHIMEEVLQSDDNIETQATNLQEQVKVEENLDNTEIPSEMETIVENKDMCTEPTQESLLTAKNESIEDLNDMTNVSDEIPIITIGTHEISNKVEDEDSEKIKEEDLNDMTNMSDEIPIITIRTHEISYNTVNIPQDIVKDEDSSESNEDQENIKESNNVSNECENKQVNVNVLQNEKISKLLDDWDDGDTDSQQSFSKSTPSTTVANNGNSINKLIDDWEDEEDT